uniref:Uncharacterized protein n=1 Tax=Xenopus tropicalis TaxID=8364 RepID=A0A803JVP8_XENTR
MFKCGSQVKKKKLEAPATEISSIGMARALENKLLDIDLCTYSITSLSFCFHFLYDTDRLQGVFYSRNVLLPWCSGSVLCWPYIFLFPYYITLLPDTMKMEALKKFLPWVGLLSFTGALYMYGGYSRFWSLGPVLLYVLYVKRLPIVVGIFSREPKESYAWLSNHLRQEFQVKSVFISNNEEWKFRQSASECNFAILYHTKRRGRLNITDVTDSLYDEELKILSATLGKKNVIVVIDDMDNANTKAKEHLLNNQPTIGSTACDLFLFSSTEKESLPVVQQSSITDKLASMRKLVQGPSYLSLLHTRLNFRLPRSKSAKTPIL